MIEHKQIAQFCKEHCQDFKDVTDIFDEIDKVEIKNSFKKTLAKKLNKIIVVVEFCNDLNNQAASEDAKFLFKTLRMRNLNNMNDLYNAYDLCNASNVWVSPKKMYFGQLFKRLHREKQIYRHNCTSNKWGHC